MAKAQPRTRVLRVLVNRQEERAYKAKAARKKTSVSTWFRQLAEAAR